MPVRGGVPAPLLSSHPLLSTRGRSASCVWGRGDREGGGGEGRWGGVGGGRSGEKGGVQEHQIRGEVLGAKLPKDSLRQYTSARREQHHTRTPPVTVRIPERSTGKKCILPTSTTGRIGS